MSKAEAFLKHLLLLTAVLSIVGCDRVTKHAAIEFLSGEPSRSYFHDVVRLAYAENTGAFLSLGADLPGSVRFPLFIVAAGLMLMLFAATAVLNRWSGWRLFGLCLFIAGGASNWLDRLTSGSVVDFLNVGIGPVRTGIFNVADMAIMAGFLIVAICEFRKGGLQS
jgi:signal peptidase II